MAAIVVARRRPRREQRGFFSTPIDVFGNELNNILSKHIFCQAILFLISFRNFQDDLEPSTRNYAIPERLSTLHFFGLQFFSTYSGFFIILFFICDYTNLRCAWYIALHLIDPAGKVICSTRSLVPS